MMMVIEGVSGRIANDTHALELSVAVKLLNRETDGIIAEMDLMQGDGMCMLYHRWINGDFGEDVVATSRT